MTKPNAFTIPRASSIARQLQKDQRSAKTPTKAQHFVIPPAHSYHATQKLMKAAI
jgi:hypothetical protein